MLEMKYEPTDPLVAALLRLCDRVGGYEVIARQTGLSRDALWQIINGIKLPSGNPRGLGPKTRSAITEAFPDWLADVDRHSKATRLRPGATAGEALIVIGHALLSADRLKRKQVMSVLEELVADPENAAHYGRTLDETLQINTEKQTILATQAVRKSLT